MMITEEVTSAIDKATLLKVARAVLDESILTNPGTHSLEALTALHGDQRTVAILKLTGEAPLNGIARGWSAIVKVIDPSIPPNIGVGWCHPELEEQVYAHDLFTNNDVTFRPARCYATQNTPSGLMLFWLEDLTGAVQPPWSADHYSLTAYNLGRFSGYYATVGRIPQDFALPSNNFAERWKVQGVVERLHRFAKHVDSEPIRVMFTKEQALAVIDTLNYVPRFIRRASSLPTALAHGDSHARNLFPFGDETVAIDWAGVSHEPLGADLGVLIGSGITHGVDEAEMVLENADEFYSRYIDGLTDSGWSGDRAAIRTGFFAQFGTVLNTIATIGGGISAGEAEVHRDYIKARTGTRLEDLPQRLSSMAPAITDYLAEFRSLAG